MLNTPKEIGFESVLERFHNASLSAIVPPSAKAVRHERMIELLASALLEGHAMAAAESAQAKRTALLAILEEEEPRLTADRGPMQEIREIA